MKRSLLLILALLITFACFGCKAAKVEQEPVVLEDSGDTAQETINPSTPVEEATKVSDTTPSPTPEVIVIERTDEFNNVITGQNGWYKIFELSEVDSESLSEPFEATIELEGMKEPYQAKTYSSKHGYEITYDFERFHVGTNDEYDFFEPENPNPELYPQIYVAIKRIISPTKEESTKAFQEFITSDKVDYVPEEVKDTTIGSYDASMLSVNIGNQWDSIIFKYYMIEANNSTFLIKTQYFLEAAEGYGARISAMLDSIQIVE